MNSVQLHLALTHVPVILSLVGVVMLIVALLIKNNILIRASYVVLVVAGVAAIPVFLTGEGAEEAVENLPGVSESIIEEHEEVAKFAMIAISVAGFFALAAIVLQRWLNTARIARIFVLLISLVSAGLMIQTAHLGGQIRHSEIRNSASLQQGGENENNYNDGQKTDDD
jgi:uncharacterized membrane protein